ncbi:MAG: glutamate-5-semialdehyde dehydrogenase [Lachnospiraceae bacterium]|nr:glutamate-5-semialdehyde dehydrogenase [Lachnospiraceae bacterium]
MTNLEQMGQQAVNAKYEIQLLTTERKNEALKVVANKLIEKKAEIIKENELDIQAGKEKGMHSGLLDRLKLDEGRIQAMAEGILQIVDLPDPIGQVIEQFVRPNGLQIEKRRVPLGVIGIIYESRPNVTADAFGLCFKAGNVVILKGGSDAIHSNIAITNAIREGLKEAGIVQDAIQLIENTDREVTKAFMGLKQYVDVLIPRGSAGLIRTVTENSTIPVIETGTGNCHIYVDEFADLKMAADILKNAKTQRIGVCNACESLVIHKAVATEFLPMAKEALSESQVEIRGDEETLTIIPDCAKATEEDFGTEYLDYIISSKIVNNVDEAISHINKYNTKHSEAIITENKENAEKFLKGVDAACVYVNASTRYTDGFEFGFGAEIGISTQMLHARGPMGLKELTSYKYAITGNGQVRP